MSSGTHDRADWDLPTFTLSERLHRFLHPEQYDAGEVFSWSPRTIEVVAAEVRMAEACRQAADAAEQDRAELAGDPDPEPDRRDALERLAGSLAALTADLDRYLGSRRPGWVEPEPGRPACPRCQGAGCLACGQRGVVSL